MPRALLGGAWLFLGACALTPERDFAAGLGVSALPNVGLTGLVSQVIHADEERTWAFEIESAYQFLDDEDVVDDGNPPADDWFQLQVGFRRTKPLQGRRFWTSRVGVAWFRALGEPNLISKPGDYVGLYGGIGFMVHVTDYLSVGPEFTILATLIESFDDFAIVPQVAWRFNWHF